MTHSHGTLSLKIKQYMSNWNFYYEKNHSWTKMPLLDLTTKSEDIIGTMSNTESRREIIPLIPLSHPPVTIVVMSCETQHCMSNVFFWPTRLLSVHTHVPHWLCRRHCICPSQWALHSPDLDFYFDSGLRFLLLKIFVPCIHFTSNHCLSPNCIPLPDLIGFFIFLLECDTDENRDLPFPVAAAALSQC